MEIFALLTRSGYLGGWHDILDIGDISTARGTEMMLAIGHAVMGALSPAEVAFKVVR